MSRQASPYRAARTAKRELKQKMTAGAAAIMGSITCKGRGDEPDLFMPILRVAALLEQAIAHDPGAISTNLVEQAAESEQGATRLLAAFETVVEQEEMELGTFEIREDPMTEEEMDDAIHHQMALALAASFDATDGSESSLVLGGLTEAIAACRVPMPDTLASTHQVSTYLKDLVTYLDQDPLKKGWMGLVLNENEKVCFRLQRDQIDLKDLTSAAAKTWAHTPSSIELTSLLAPKDESEAEDESEARSRDGDETDDAEEAELEKSIALHEELETRDAALVAMMEKRLASLKNAFSKRLEQETAKTSSLKEEVKELKALVHRLQVDASGSPSPPSVPLILRELPAAKLEE